MSRSARSVVVVLTTIASAYGCALDWTLPPSSAPAGDASTESTVPDGSDDAATTTESGDPGGGDGGIGVPDGSCTSNANCSPDQVCIFTDYGCGKLDGQLGTCVSIKSGSDPCAAAGGQYCGCDGNLYETACTALFARVDLSVQSCQPTSGTQLGYAYCPPGTFAIDDPTRPHTSRYRCESLVTGCDASTCECLVGLFCGSGQKGGGKCEGSVVHCP